MMLFAPFLLLWLLAPSSAVNIDLQTVASGLTAPLGILDDPLEGDRMFIVEKGGKVKILKPSTSTILSPAFLDFTSLVTQDVHEGGLLGMAFHPDYATNGYFFIHYTKRSPGGSLVSIVRRLSVDSSNPNKAAQHGSKPSELVLKLFQPASNHNGGQLLFGPDGMLYIAFGDGGPGSDPDNRGQNRKLWYGKILRIDVDVSNANQAGYSIPADNPYANHATFKKEIFHYGLRNPWRSSFDRQTGDMFIGDVGQNSFEEINMAKNGQQGLNFGWRRKEGSKCFIPAKKCLKLANGKKVKVKGPLITYPHAEPGCYAVTGGYRYRGTAIRGLVGKYIYTDYCLGTIWAFSFPGIEVLKQTTFRIGSFGEDRFGEIYVVDLESGTIYKIVSAG